MILLYLSPVSFRSPFITVLPIIILRVASSPTPILRDNKPAVCAHLELAGRLALPRIRPHRRQVGVTGGARPRRNNALRRVLRQEVDNPLPALVDPGGSGSTALLLSLLVLALAVFVVKFVVVRRVGQQLFHRLLAAADDGAVVVFVLAAAAVLGGGVSGAPRQLLPYVLQSLMGLLVRLGDEARDQVVAEFPGQPLKQVF
jgi:hypothetical protein